MSWENVSGLGVDNINANIGNRNSLETRVLRKNAEVVIAGCTWQILHNAAEKASEAFAAVSMFDLGSHCVDVFHWFENPTKRKSILKKYYNFWDLDYQEVIMYISSRWLCTERCQSRAEEVSRLAVSYFQSESERIQRFLRLHETFLDAMSELYMYFYQSVLPTFTNVNKLLQTEEPLIQSCMTRLKEL